MSNKAEDNQSGLGLPSAVANPAENIPTSDEIPPELLDILNRNPQSRDLLLTVARSTLQTTKGLYPPPLMMAEYQKIDPAINTQILSQAKSQAEHRRNLEVLSTQRSEDRLDAAQRGQQVVAVGSLLVAAAMILAPIVLRSEVSWQIVFAATLIAAVGIGGRPAATVLTTWLAKRLPKE